MIGLKIYFKSLFGINLPKAKSAKCGLKKKKETNKKLNEYSMQFARHLIKTIKFTLKVKLDIS